MCGVCGVCGWVGVCEGRGVRVEELARAAAGEAAQGAKKKKKKKGEDDSGPPLPRTGGAFRAQRSCL